MQITTIENNLFEGPFYERLHSEVMTRAPKLQQGIAYKLKKICGKSYWELLDHCEATQAGLYMSHMTEKGLLPFSPAGKSSDNHRLYYPI